MGLQGHLYRATTGYQSVDIEILGHVLFYCKGRTVNLNQAYCKLNGLLVAGVEPATVEWVVVFSHTALSDELHQHG